MAFHRIVEEEKQIYVQTYETIIAVKREANEINSSLKKWKGSELR